MNKQDVQLLFQYNQWANARILNAASGVTLEQFLAPASYPHGGLRSTLTHALSAEWVWRKRWEGDTPSGHLKPDEFPTFAALHSRWLEEENLLMKFVHAQTDDDLNEAFQYATLDGQARENVLWHAMTHVVNHGTQHRSEAAAMLTDMGRSPGDVDMILFLRER